MQHWRRALAPAIEELQNPPWYSWFMTETHSLDSLSDRALLCQFGDLVQQDHEGKAHLLRHIDLIERRKLFAKQGHSSMFDFLCSRYHMSESTAFKRIGAARTARRFPVLFEMVARGEIHLSGIHRLKAHLTPENCEQVLNQAKHATIRQIEKLVAQLAPQPDVPSRLRALPVRTTADSTGAPPPLLAAAAFAPTAFAPTTSAPTAFAPTTSAPLHTAPDSTPVAPVPPPRRSPDPTPLSPGRYKLQVTLSEAAKDKLEQLQDLLAHQIPNGDPAPIIERALDVLLTEVRKQKTGITDKPRASKPTTRASRRTGNAARVTPKAAVRREVWARDEGRCGFVGEGDHRCNETRGLEFAHVVPWAKGGEDTPANLTLRCPAHNALEADRDYGTSFMASKRKRTVVTKPLKVREPIAQYRAYRVRSDENGGTSRASPSTGAWPSPSAWPSP